jgi:hypothetical protein
MILDRVFTQAATGNGSGNVTWTAAAQQYALPPASINATVTYTLLDSGGSAWETGTATLAESGGTYTLTRGGSQTVRASSNSGSAISLTDSSAHTLFLAPDATDLGVLETAREVLTADRTYYVATTGSDSNDGLSAGSPFATIQKAVDVVCSLDLSIYQATIQLADGTYTAGAVLKSYVGVLPPIIQGNATTPANVVVSTTNVTAINAPSAGMWVVGDFRIQTTTLGNAIEASGLSDVLIKGIVFGACANSHIAAQYNGMVRVIGNYSISGAAMFHYTARYAGLISVPSAISVSITETPSFSVFAYIFEGSALRANGITFSGPATGKRYEAALNGVITTSGAGATYFPGSTAGDVTTGGQYA